MGRIMNSNLIINFIKLPFFNFISTSLELIIIPKNINIDKK